MSADLTATRSYAAHVADALAAGPPQRVAFRDADGNSRSYGQAAALLRALTAAMRRRSGAGGAAVGLLSPNRSDAWLAQWAAVAAGCRVTALHPLASTSDCAVIAKDAGLGLLLVDPSLSERADAVAAAVPGLEVLPLPDLLAEAAALPADEVAGTVPAPGPREVELLLYTGGTTGRPKGVRLGTRPLVTNLLLELAEWPWPPAPVFYACAPLSHAAGLIVLPTLWRGGTVVLASRFEPQALLSAVAQHRVSVLMLVPTMLGALLDHPATAQADLSSLAMVLYGAAPLSEPRARQAVERLGPVLVQFYGQTEAPMIITTLRREDHDLARPDRLASAGRPSPAISVALLGVDGQPVDTGQPGEVCVRGPLVMGGYWQRPEEEAAVLRDGWLHTGDLGVADDEGYLTLVGRSKDMIISGGFNVYPAEVEAVLTAHADVAACAVVGRPDERWGEAVTAYVVAAPGRAPDPTALMHAVRERKGPMHTPKAVHLLPALPLTALGKVDRQALRALTPPSPSPSPDTQESP